jgi:thiamine pyrophosphate-dependent acetolactate synthase large subunit-like protein
MAISAQLPSEAQLARAAALLNAGKRTAILAGQGALGASEKLAEVAERLGAPVAKALLGKGALPDDSPFSAGVGRADLRISCPLHGARRQWFESPQGYRDVSPLEWSL